jgi:aspartate--ammonia ligase
MSERLGLPRGYAPALAPREVEVAIKDIKDFFEANLARALNLSRISAPLFVRSGTGVNDDLNGVERPVSFQVGDLGGETVELVQSLAKWKRMALAKYGYGEGEGIYTDMNAVRPDERLDSLHSLYVDQWDWEKIIGPGERRLEVLVAAVRAIYDVIARTEFHVASRWSALRPVLPAEIAVVTSEELLARWPELTPREREDRICAERGAVFVVGIGADLADGRPHDGRAPDYDDWSSPRPDGGTGLNGDILLHHPVLGRAFEISSMGLRADAETLRRQLAIRGVPHWAERPFHRALLEGRLPQTMGGGIGQSRLCMFFLRAAHIGEVAVSLWPHEMETDCAAANVFLL